MANLLVNLGVCGVSLGEDEFQILFQDQISFRGRRGHLFCIDSSVSCSHVANWKARVLSSFKNWQIGINLILFFPQILRSAQTVKPSGEARKNHDCNRLDCFSTLFSSSGKTTYSLFTLRSIACHHVLLQAELTFYWLYWKRVVKNITILSFLSSHSRWFFTSKLIQITPISANVFRFMCFHRQAKSRTTLYVCWWCMSCHY